ncbi:MAG: hypothetical protein ACRYG4_17535 [Janthinobacterium lividum]
MVAADATARSRGIHSGMAASMAQALVAGLVVHDADPGADALALGRLAPWVLRRYAPVVATDPPDGLMIDIHRRDPIARRRDGYAVGHR